MAFQFSTDLRTVRGSQLLAKLTATTRGAWSSGTVYAAGDTVLSGSNTYICTAGGTAGATAPSGTGTGISDGGATWAYAPPVLKFYSGAEPANCAAANPSGELATVQLPMACLTTTNGVTSLAGSWSGAGDSGITTANAASFRMFDPSGTKCVMQGSVSASGGGGDLILANVSIAASQPVNVTGFTVTEGNA